eukprot:gene10557-11696_t
MGSSKKIVSDSAHPDLNQGPSELQSLALPLSYKRARLDEDSNEQVGNIIKN